MARGTDAETFGALLRGFRRAAGLTQEELAERARLSVRGVQYLEGGQTAPRQSTASLLAEALGLADADHRRLRAAAGAASDLSGTSQAASLPTPLSPLIGRERELEEVAALLEGARVVTLAGPGGCGKTRLALEAARRRAASLAGGVCFVSLAQLGGAAEVLPAIAAALRVRAAEETPPREALRAYLSRRPLLLVLDTFEHVIEAAPDLADLLSDAPGVAALITSRVELGIGGERVYRVPPLESADAARLFAERASALRQDFRLSARNADAVTTLCAKLDGLPLAIELAAAWCGALTPQALLVRLGRRLDLLVDGTRDLPPRQRTLRAAITWSHDLLSAEDRVIFRRLAVFAGGFSLDSADGVAGRLDDGHIDVLAAVTRLVRASLVQPADSADEEPRFSLLDTIREYAWERLDAAGEIETARRGHAQCIAAIGARFPLLSYARDTLTETERRAQDGAQAREYENAGAALRWCAQTNDTATAQMLIPGLMPYFTWRPTAEAVRWLRGLLLPVEGSRLPLDVLAVAVLEAGLQANWIGEWAAARDFFWAAVAVARGACRGSGDDEPAPAPAPAPAGATMDYGQIARIALTGLAWASFGTGELPEAVTRAEEALALAREAGDSGIACGALRHLSRFAFAAGDLPRALELAEQSVAAAREGGPALEISTDVSVGWLTQLCTLCGRTDEALAHARENVDWSAHRGRAGHEDLRRYRLLANVAALAAALGHHPTAARLFGAAHATAERTGVSGAPAIRLAYQRAEEATRAQIPHLFDAVWADGKALPPAGAFELAAQTVDVLAAAEAASA